MIERLDNWGPDNRGSTVRLLPLFCLGTQSYSLAALIC